MFPSSRSLFARLRRHRGLWVLAVAVLLIKLTAGTVCLADAPEQRFAVTTVVSTASLPVNMATAETSSDEANGCLLGELGGCHCVCAHTMTFPATGLLSIAKMEARFESLAIHPGFEPATPGSLLRPPIA